MMDKPISSQNRAVVSLRYSLSREASYQLSKNRAWCNRFFELNEQKNERRLLQSQQHSFSWIGYQWQGAVTLEELECSNETLKQLLLEYLIKPELLPTHCEIKGIRL